MFRYLWLTIVLMIAMSGLTIDASIEKAILLKAHGLNDDAKRELINLIFQEDSESKDKPHAYYLLGAIAFDENRIRAATKTWGYIIEEYPGSDEALLVKERIDELSKVTLSVYTESVETADYSLAKLYLKNADFWSEDKDDRWMIDSSWIPKVKFAVKWYDKVISEFPRSEVNRTSRADDLGQAKKWFDEVIANSGENDTFYRQISEERNRHIIKGVK